MTSEYFQFRYPGFGTPSSCELKVWRKLNLIIASHQNFKGTSPINAAERIAKKAARDFKLNLKKLNMIIQVPADCSTTDKEYFSVLKFAMTWRRGKISIDNTNFLDIRLEEVKKITSGSIKIKANHNIKYKF